MKGKGWTIFFILFLLFLTLHIYNVRHLKPLSTPKDVQFSHKLLLPNKFLAMTSSGFKGIRSEFIYLQAVNFLMSHKKLDMMTKKDWQWFYKMLNASNYLDPYLQDTLFLANAMTWSGKRYKQAITILKRGADKRTWDWRIPFFVGFDYFYFLKDYKEGAKWLLKAAKRPHSPSAVLTSLAATLSTRDGQLEMGITILKNQIAHTKNKRLKRFYKKRLASLKHVLILEQAIRIYQKRFRHYPKTIKQLVTSGILPRIPEDPFGAHYQIKPDGHIKKIYKSNNHHHQTSSRIHK